MTNLQRFRHDFLWYLAKQKIKQTLTDARLTYLQQVADNRGFYTKQIKR